MASIRDVAQLANVSISTVSRYFNHPDTVPENTRKRIESVIAQVNYRPNASASNIRKRRTGILGVAMPFYSSPVFSAMLDSIVRTAVLYQQSIILAPPYTSKEEEAASLTAFMSSPMDALLYMPRQVAAPLNELKFYQNIPIVGLYRKSLGFPAPCVFPDNEKSGELPVKYLARLNHKRIAFCAAVNLFAERQIRTLEEFEALCSSPSSGAYNACDRYAGYRRALTECGLDFDRSLIYFHDFSIQRTPELISQILERDLPDGIIMDGIMSTMGILHEFSRLHIRVPEDISIIGYDETLFSSRLSVPLTTIDVNPRAIGETAVHLANRMLNGETDAASVMTDVSLIIRDSAALRTSCPKLP